MYIIIRKVSEEEVEKNLSVRKSLCYAKSDEIIYCV